MENLAAIAQAIGEQKQGLNGEARMLGIHMEGPFLIQTGAARFSRKSCFRPPSRKMRAYIEASQGPDPNYDDGAELDPQGELIRFCRSQNVLLSGGIPSRRLRNITGRIEQGLACSTHYRQRDAANGPARTRRVWRGAAFRSNLQRGHLRSVFISVSRCWKSCSGSNRCRAYRDFRIPGPMSGLPAGVYTIRGHKRTISEAGLVLLEDGTIAGSSKNMLYGVRNLAEYCLNRSQRSLR